MSNARGECFLSRIKYIRCDFFRRIVATRATNLDLQRQLFYSIMSTWRLLHRFASKPYREVLRSALLALVSLHAAQLSGSAVPAAVPELAPRAMPAALGAIGRRRVFHDYR